MNKGSIMDNTTKLVKRPSHVPSKQIVIKSKDTKLKQATFVVLQPDVVDAHGDVYDENEIRKAKESFNKACMRANLFHMMETDTFEFIESYRINKALYLDFAPIVTGHNPFVTTETSTISKYMLTLHNK